MIKMRLVDEHKRWEFKFFANGPDSLKSGCESGWKKYRTQFGQGHMQSEYTLRERMKWIDSWLSEKKIKWRNDPGKKQQCIDQALFWRHRDTAAYEKNRMKTLLAIHLKSSDGIDWLGTAVIGNRAQNDLPYCQNGTTHGVKASENNWHQLWMAIEKIHNHDKNITAFCNQLPNELGVVQPKRPNHLHIVKDRLDEK